MAKKDDSPLGGDAEPVKRIQSGNGGGGDSTPAGLSSDENEDNPEHIATIAFYVGIYADKADYGGVLVRRVYPASRAAHSQLAPLDVIKKVGATDVRDIASLAAIAATLPDDIEMQVQRGTKLYPARLKSKTPPKTYSINRRSRVRHNSTCHAFASPNCVPCGPYDGKPCGDCGG